MPNYCDNKVIITGKPSTLQKIVDNFIVRDENFSLTLDFGKIKPISKEDENNPNFNIRKHWGTDRYPFDLNYELMDGYSTLVITFVTAWYPSLLVSKELSRLYPRVKIWHGYEEGGMGFSGYSVFQGGEKIEAVLGGFDDYPITDHEEEGLELLQDEEE